MPKNIFLVVTARSLNPSLRIITQCLEEKTIPKMIKAGADRVVSPTMIGGLRIASELIRPADVNFLNLMLRAGKGPLRVEEVRVKRGSPYEGKTFKPPLKEKLQADDSRILLGEMEACRDIEGIEKDYFNRISFCVLE